MLRQLGIPLIGALLVAEAAFLLGCGFLPSLLIGLAFHVLLFAMSPEEKQ